jgi:hypothetical protein
MRTRLPGGMLYLKNNNPKKHVNIPGTKDRCAGKIEVETRLIRCGDQAERIIYLPGIIFCVS